MISNLVKVLVSISVIVLATTAIVVAAKPDGHVTQPRKPAASASASAPAPDVQALATESRHIPLAEIVDTVPGIMCLEAQAKGYPWVPLIAILFAGPEGNLQVCEALKTSLAPGFAKKGLRVGCGPCGTWWDRQQTASK